VAPFTSSLGAARDLGSVQPDSEPAAEFVPTTPSEQIARDQADAGTPDPGRFTGTLHDLSVADLVQILQLAQKGAVISVRHEGVESRLWCSAGLIIDAESGRLRGEPAVHRILGLENGCMLAELRAEPRERKIFATTPHLLLEAARRKDEAAELRRRLGDERRCYRVGALAPADPAQMNQVELSLLQGFGNLQTLREAVDASAFGEVETLEALSRCIGAGYLVDSGSTGSKRPAPSADSFPEHARSSAGSAPAEKHVRGRWRPRSRPRLAAALTAAVLLTVGYLAGRRATRPLPAPSTTSEPSLVAGREPRSAPGPELLELRVEPAGAEIWLDARESVIGHLQTPWTRNGAVHELRVAAPGFVPARMFFADVAPPPEIRLEPLPTATACPDRVPSEVPAVVDAALLAPAAATTSTLKSRRVRPLVHARVREARASASPSPPAVVESDPRPAKQGYDERSAIIRSVDF
jgi:hypothetical protein